MQIRGRVDAQLNVEAEHQRHRYDLQERRGPPLDPAEIQQPSHQSKLSLSLSRLDLLVARLLPDGTPWQQAERPGNASWRCWTTVSTAACEPKKRATTSAPSP